MKRVLLLTLPCLLLAGCGVDRSSIASASALPAYQSAVRAVIDQAAKHPFSEAQKAGIKQADDKAYAALIAINAAEMAKAAALHEQVQGL
jgi:hypothetical protein